MPHSYIRWTLSVNSNSLIEFYKICEYLHKEHHQNCFYNKSATFRYVIRKFNDNMKLDGISKNELLQYHNKQKKNKEIGISLFDYEYNPFLENCKNLKVSRNDMIRILMEKLIEDNKINLSLYNS